MKRSCSDAIRLFCAARIDECVDRISDLRIGRLDPGIVLRSSRNNYRRYRKRNRNPRHGTAWRPSSARITPTQRIAVTVCVSIDPANQPYRVALNVSSGGRIEVSEVVQVQPRLPVEYLPGETQVIFERAGTGRILVGGICPEGIGEPAPHQSIVRRAGDRSRGVQLISVHVVNRNSGTIRAQRSDRNVAQPYRLFYQVA